MQCDSVLNEGAVLEHFMQGTNPIELSHKPFITISTGGGFYLILAITAKQLGSYDPVYLKYIYRVLALVGGGGLMGESVKNSLKNRSCLHNAVFLLSINRIV